MLPKTVRMLAQNKKKKNNDNIQEKGMKERKNKKGRGGCVSDSHWLKPTRPWMILSFLKICSSTT